MLFVCKNNKHKNSLIPMEDVNDKELIIIIYIR